MKHPFRGVAYHVTDYNDDYPPEGVDHRALCVYIGDVSEETFRPALQARAEWVIGRAHLGFGVRLEDDLENPLAFTFEVPGLSLFTSFEARALTRVVGWLVKHSGPSQGGYGHEREISLSFHDDIVWWRVWADPSGWSRERPRWREGNVNLLDALLGKETYIEQTLEERPVAVPLPEGAYPAVVRLIERCHRRPRWFGRRSRFADVEPVLPIPCPTKHSDDDKLYSMCTAASSIAEAVGKVVGSVLRDRWRHGGRNWAPLPRTEAAAG